jgi:hypothetical protein
MGAALVAAAFVFASAFAQDTSAPPSPAASSPPAKFKTVTRELVVDPDGSFTVTAHTELQVLNPAYVAALSQVSLNYIESMQSLDVKEAYTLKADGRKLPVAPSAIITQQAPHAMTSPLFSDMKVKIIVFPGVEAGDTLVYTTVVHSKPQIPGQFTYDTVFPPSLAFDSAKTTVTVPASLPLAVDAQLLGVETKKSADTISYAASYANPAPMPDDNQPLSLFDRAPRLSLSSFKSYDDFAAAYAALAEPTIVPTAAIKSKADELVQGAHNRRDRARKIYDWVSSHVRYVAIEFGNGSIVPHDADSVLANGYGDCKDHAVLFVALLKAAGIAANLVLINGDNAYSVAKVPTSGAFNHMIVWLPDFALYADTTARTLPFGYLPREEYGKTVLLIGAKSQALQRIPAMTPDDSVIHYVATDRLDDTAHVTGTNATTGTGAIAGFLKGIGELIQAGGGAAFSADILKAHGMPRGVGAYTAPPPTELADSYAVEGHYATAGSWRGVLEERPFLPPDGLHLVTMTGSVFLGPLGDEKFKAAASVPCYSGRYIADYTLQLPKALRPGDLPADTTLKTDHLAYSSQWSTSKQSITVHREFTANFGAQLCGADVMQEVRAAMVQIAKDLEARVTIKNTAPSNPPPPVQ